MESKIFLPVKNALQALVTGFSEGLKKEGKPLDQTEQQEFLSEIITAFSQIDSFETKLTAMHAVFKRFPAFEALEEFCFDLLMVNFFTADARQLDENYLESAEWLAIEDKTLDRGTELLNVLIYINECQETETEATLDDFLKEFLLTEDDLYQDEYQIYEPVIKNQNLTEGSVQDIVNAAKKITDENIKEIFVPLMVYFNDTESRAERQQQVLEHSAAKPTDAAIFMALNAFTDSLEDVG